MTENPAIIFEDNSVGRLKKEVWDGSEQEIDKLLRDYEVPSSLELRKPGSYIQTTVRQKLIENRRKNEIVSYLWVVRKTMGCIQSQA